MFHEPIVPAAAGYGVLRAEVFRNSLEGCLHVVVQPPNHHGIEACGDMQFFEIVLDRVEVCLAGVAQKLLDVGCLQGQLMAGFHLAVQDPQGVSHETALAIGA